METIDWSKLGFDYHKTDWNVRYSYTDGKWSEMEVTQDEYIKMHMSASCLHYGIELFEGLKAFRGVDGKIRLFRVEENAHRLQSSAKRLCLPVPTTEMIVNRDHLTTLMITHNMKDAITHGNRLIMMMEGKIILDIRGEEKKKLTVEDLLHKFEEVSGEEFTNDKAILG